MIIKSLIAKNKMNKKLSAFGKPLQTDEPEVPLSEDEQKVEDMIT